MKHNLLKSLIISVILLTGVSNAWGDIDTRQFLIGDATGGNWTENKFTYPVDSYYGQDNKCCIYVWMQNGQHFAFCNYTGSQYGPKINNSEPIYDGSAIHDNNNGRGAYEKHDQDGNVITDSDGKTIPTTNAWKYTGNTGLVRICVDYSFEGNVWRPYVWVEELTEVMKGNEIMFYFGNTWGWTNSSGKNEQYLRTANNTDPSNIQFVGQAGFGQPYHNTYATCCKVPTGRYYISNNSTWSGIQMKDNAEAGAMYSLTNNGSDIITVISGAKPTWESNQTPFEVYKGTKESGIAATCNKSVINKTNTIYYCYTQDNQNFHRFNPDDVSNLPLGTYTVWAIACDGHIAVRSATSVELRIKDYTITLAGTDYGTYTVKCGEQTITVSNQTRTITDVAAGTQLTITNIHPNEGYDQTMIYSTDGENYTEFGQEKSMIVNSDIIISEDFRTTETHDIYLKINGDSYTYWINKDDEALPRILFVHGTNSKDQYLKSDGGNLEDKIRNFDRIVVTSAYNLYKITAPIGYHSFYLYPPHDYTASQLFDHKIILDKENCYEPKDADPTGANGDWFGATITTHPTGRNTDFSDGIGRYGIEYNGTIHYATTTTSQNASFTVPYGASIRVLKGEPGNEAYTGSLIANVKDDTKSDTIIFENNATDTTIVVLKDLVFDDFFVTKKPHIVYLGVPDGDIKTSWETAYGVSTPKSIAYAEHQYNPANAAICLEEYSAKEGSITYYKFTIPAGWNTFRFELKDVTLYNQYGNAPPHATIRFPYGIPTDENNCFTLTGGSGHDFTGTWGKAPQCTVTLGWPNIGRYGVKDYLGSIHYVSAGGNTTFTVPYGSQVEVLKGEPRNDAYNGVIGMCDETNTVIVERFYDGKNNDNFVTITRNTMFDDLFGTEEEHVVYLGVPNKGIDACWHIDNTDDIYVCMRAQYDGGGKGLAVKEAKFVIDDVTYYKYTLRDSLYNFQFQRKTGEEDRNTPICKSRQFIYQIPTTEYNCFMLDGSKSDDEYNGYWTKLPKPNVGDYRVLYAEKELIKTHEEGESEDWETAFRTVYEHPSDIIPKGEASKTISLHINTSQKRGDKTVHPMVILQQFQQMPESNTYKWVNLQAHTVLPLKATGNMGMLPGRKKAFGDLPFYDNGIEAIKNDTTYSNSSRGDGLYKGSGVWNFTVTQGVSQSGTGTTVTLNVGNTTRYTGKYYIRTEALTNGWNNYKDNLMTYSDYADYNSGFSHYFCKWLLTGHNVKFTIANDYAQSISDPLYADATDLWGKPIIDEQMVMVDNSQVLDEDANVRFAWYEMNNFVHRAYLGGSTHVHDRFLVVKGDDNKIFSHYVGEGLPAQGEELPKGKDNGSDPRYGLYEDEEIFRDDANWIYHADVRILLGCNATITAKHDGVEQYFIKDAPLVHGYDPAKAKNKYPIRLLYDFKINRLITGYIPNGNNSTNIEPFTTNLMLIRKHHEQATQLLFNSNAKTTQGAYGVMTFERNFLRNPNKTNKERAAYFISFPFDVKISDIFGFGQFYKHWFIQYYDGEARAKNGLWADTDTYWKHITDPNTVLKAYQGYALLFSLSNIEKSGVLDASKEISLYFPSTDNNIGNITDANPEVTVDVPAHICTIEREYRKFKDSNWNLIGVPAYADVSGFVNKTFKDPYNNEVYFYWKRDASTDEYEVCDVDDSRLLTFQTMHAYMLQYAGVINWKAHTMSQHDYSNKLIARRNTEQEASHTLRITLNQADKKLDQTYVRLQEEDATADFDMNKDQYKIKKAKANIYSLIQNAVGQIEAGANVLPLQTTIVPLGVIIKTAGEYTFSMPDGTDGIIAELIDYQTNTRTNLLLDNYTVTLPAGTNNSRFALSLQPDKTVTSVDNIGNEATGDKVKKYLIDGKLYLQKDGVLYDAQGHSL